MSALYQLPTPTRPFPVGARVRSLARPWFGVGVVIPSEPAGSFLGDAFAIQWPDRSVTRGQIVLLALVRAT